MKRFVVPVIAALGLAGPALAESGPSPACLASLYDYLAASAADCPLSLAGFTLYGVIDAGYGFETHGSRFNRSFSPAEAYLISKQNSRPLWLWSPNALSQSVFGVKVSEPIAPGWSLVGALEFGFDPYSLMLANSPQSLYDNNGVALARQSSNGDSSRAGQFDNSQGYLGVSDTTLGTAVIGRVNTLSLDGIIAYDPMGGSNAFSPIGWSGSFAGFGDTEIARSNTAFKYRVSWNNLRFGALAQVGGYDQGNGSAAEAQASFGADVGALSVDAVFGWAKDAVSLGNYTALPKGYVQNDLKATLSDNVGFMVLAKYAAGPATVYGGFERARLSNASDVYPYGFRSLGGYVVLPSAITYNAYTINRVLTTVWTGLKYAVNAKLDLAAAVYYESQNDYYAKPCKGTGTHIASNACAGSLDALSFLVDYHPLKRLDLYAGVMLSNVFGGLASGYLQTQNVDPTVGLRFRF